MNKQIKLICPNCRKTLLNYICNSCNSKFERHENVVVFNTDKDLFYEGKFVENKDAKNMLPALLPEKIKLLIWKFFVKFSVILRYQHFFVKHLDKFKTKN
ncbi:MAG: hypothetical protein WCG01_04775, partial [bacterium]